MNIKSKLFIILFFAIAFCLLISTNCFASDKYITVKDKLNISRILKVNATIHDSFPYFFVYDSSSNDSFQPFIVYANSPFVVGKYNDENNDLIFPSDRSYIYFTSLVLTEVDGREVYNCSNYPLDVYSVDSGFSGGSSVLSRTVASNHAITTLGNTVLFEPTHSGSDVNEDTDLNTLLGTSSTDIESIIDSLTNGDWSDRLDETNTTDISNGSNELGKQFKNMFGIFSFVNSIKSVVSDIYNVLDTTSEAPSLAITINSKYLNGTYTIIDLSWYAPYKEYGDSIICMFCYLGFIWHCFTKAPSIISGADTTYVGTDGIISQELGFDGLGSKSQRRSK